MEPQSGIKTWQWVVTVIVIIVLIVIGVMVFSDKGEVPSTTNPDESPAVVDTDTAINRIVMSDQYPGNVVYLSSVQVSADSWVVVQTDNAGLPGKVIGSAKFKAGISPGKITLTQPMVDGATYYAVIYSDNGGASFDATKNTPVRDSKGNVIMKVFKASATVGVDFKG
jgi:hypothetical protein